MPHRDSSITYTPFHFRTREKGTLWYYELYECKRREVKTKKAFLPPDKKAKKKSESKSDCVFCLFRLR
jgi:hypothetical protein